MQTDWKCYAKPAALNGEHCGFTNEGKPASFRGMQVCRGCGCTKKASDDRLKALIATGTRDLPRKR